MGLLQSPMAGSAVTQAYLECEGVASVASHLPGGASRDPVSAQPLTGVLPPTTYSEAHLQPCAGQPSEQAVPWEACSGLPSTAVRELQLQDLPAPLAQMLQSMQGQLELMARTAQLLDQRLSATERLVADVRRELLRSPVAGAAQHPTVESEDVGSFAAAWAPGGGPAPEMAMAAGATEPVPLVPSSLPATLLC